MLKFNYLFSFIILFFLAGNRICIAQKMNYEQKLRAIYSLDSLLANYQSFSTLREVGSDSITDNSIDKFRSMFEPGALIWDEFTPAFFFDYHVSDSYRLQDRTLDEYLDGLKRFYKEGLGKVKITNISVNLNDFKKDAVYVTVKKDISATSTYNHAIVKYTDTTMLTISFYDDYSVALISRIANLGKNTEVIITNDRDGDLVMNEDDRCDGTKGKVEYSGCPDPKGDLLSLNINGGYLFSIINYDTSVFRKKINDGYNNIEFDPNQDHNVSASLGNIKKKLTGFQYHLAAEFELMVTNKRRFGIGLGASLGKPTL